VWFCLGVLVCSITLLEAAEVGLDKTLNKFAGAALRKYPELRGSEKTSEARERLVKQWLDSEAASIDEKELKELKRRKREYDSYSWTTLMKRYELANLDDPLSEFLFEQASRTNLKAEEFYVLSILLKDRLALKMGEREEVSKTRLRAIGKAFTAYVKENQSDPSSIELLSTDPTQVYAVHPESGEKVRWCYVGEGPAEIRGTNRYRLIAYAPFRVGAYKDKRWVVYKGGQLGEWKESTLQKQVAAMRLENLAIAREEEIKAEKEIAIAKAPKSARTPKSLKIQIKELW
jgi:hypothetical protein